MITTPFSGAFDQPRAAPPLMPTPRSPSPARADADLDPAAAPEPFYGRPSKTQRKKASHDLQDLGKALVELPDSQLDRLPMAESLLEAIRSYKQTASHEGRRRQMQYIGKLMRRADPEPLREAVDAAALGPASDALALHQAEAWRAELLANDEALTRWGAEHPQTDLQQLRSLVRAARKDAAARPEERSGRAFRDLFRFIRGESASPQPSRDDHDE